MKAPGSERWAGHGTEGAALFAIAFFAAVLGWFKTADPDFFFHLKIGQIILDKKSLPVTNLLSAHFAGYPWKNPSWLFQALLALIFDNAGWLGISILKVTLAFGLGAVTYKTSREAGASAPVSLAVSLFLLSVTRFAFTERPHFFSMIFFGLTVLLAERLRQGERGFSFWALPAMFIVWTNIHFMNNFGLYYLLGVPLAESALALYRKQSVPESARVLFLAFAASLAASFINPEGPSYLGYVWDREHFEISTMFDLGDMRWSDPVGHPFLYGLLLISAAAFALAGEKRDWPMAAAALFFAALAIKYRRALPEGAFLAAALFARSWTGIAKVKVARIVVSVLGLMAVSSTVFALKYDENYPYKSGSGLNGDIYPVAAVDFVLENRLPGEIFNEFGAGGYAAWKLYPEYGVLQDGRIHAYPPEFFREFQNAYLGNRWPEFLDKYGINTGIIANRHVSMVFPGAVWAPVFWDEHGSVLVRRSAVAPEFLEKYEYRFLKPGGASEARTAEDEQRLLYEIDRNLSESGEQDWRLLRFAADEMLSAGRREEAVAILERAQKSSWEEAEAWIAIGDGHLAAGEKERARKAYEKALEINPAEEGLRDFIRKM